MPAVGNDDDAPESRAAPGMRPVAGMGRRDEGVMRAEDGELVAGKRAREVRGTERHEAPHRAPLIHLDQVAGHESPQAVADEIDLRRSRFRAEQLDLLAQAVSQPLIVDARRIGEGREVRHAGRSEATAQNEKIGRVAEKAVHQDGRGGMRGHRIEVLSTDDQSEGHRERRGAHR